MFRFFDQARKIAALEQQVKFEQDKAAELDRLLEREEARLAKAEEKNVALDSLLQQARRSEMRTLRHHADMMSKLAKNQSSFVRTAEAKEVEPDDTPKPVVDDRVKWAAEQMMQFDEEHGITPDTLESYIAIIQADPDKYLVQ